MTDGEGGRNGPPPDGTPTGSRRALVLAYDGTGYCGWQLQPGVPTLQGTVEAALERILGGAVRVHASGRTDAGVHALGQVAHFDDPGDRDPEALRPVLNAVLPAAIRVRRLLAVPPTFHARGSARSKTYLYHWHLSDEPGGRRAVERSVPPLRRLAFLGVRSGLDLGAMRAAARHLEGTHDFTALSKTMPAARGTVRTVHSVRLLRLPRGLRLVVTGEGFLYGMVRMMAGLLLDVGEGRRAAADVPALLEAADRTRAPPSLAPHGLILWRVRYGPLPGVGAETLRLLS